MNNKIKQSGLIGSAIILVGAGFFIQHWPHGFLIISLGYLVFCVFWFSLFIDIFRSKMNIGMKPKLSVKGVSLVQHSNIPVIHIPIYY